MNFDLCLLWCVSEEEAKKKIYNVAFGRYYGFGCEIDEETSNKLDGKSLIVQKRAWTAQMGLSEFSNTIDYLTLFSW